MKPSVRLLLIAKNEGHVIERAIASGFAVGCSSATVVVDEATTDNTTAAARSAGAEVIVRPFAGSIAAARNEAVSLVKERCDYVLMLDPDDVYEGRLPEDLTADVYYVEIHDEGSRGRRVQLFKSGCGVLYEGIRHERALFPDSASRATVEGLIYKRIGGGYQDTLGREAKFGAHIEDLKVWLKSHPNDAHARMMLAQSYRDFGDFEHARYWYEQRLLIEDDDESRYLAALEVAFLVERRDPPVDFVREEVVAAYLRAHELAPMHAEPLFHLACYLRERGAVASAWHFARRAAEVRVPPGRTIIDIEVYQWKAKAELAVLCWLLGDRASSLNLLRELTRIDAASEWARKQSETFVRQDPPPRVFPWPPSRGHVQQTPPSRPLQES